MAIIPSGAGVSRAVVVLMLLAIFGLVAVSLYGLFTIVIPEGNRDLVLIMITSISTAMTAAVSAAIRLRVGDKE